MLFSLIRHFIGRCVRKRDDAVHQPSKAPLRLHVGGQVAHADWKILDIQPGPNVSFVGPCTDLSQFDADSIGEIYASHVIEHLGYRRELALAFREFNRVLVPGGSAYISVPDLPTLCDLYLDPALTQDERYRVMKMMFGGQIDGADFHHVGLNEEFLTSHLRKAGFTDIVRTGNFGLFDDSSSFVFKGRPISLNVCARKPRG